MVDVHRNTLPAGPSSTVDADTVDGLHASELNQMPGGWSALPAGVNVSDVPDAWPSDALSVYVVNAGSLQGVSESGLLMHLGRSSRRVQYMFVDGTRSVRVRQAQAGATSWDAWSKVSDAGHDGDGSGVDADTVDGIHATSFLQTANLLTAIQAIDGTGSGVDADKLDGAERSAFFELGAASAWGAEWAVSSTGALCMRVLNGAGRTLLRGELVAVSKTTPGAVLVRSGWNQAGIVVDNFDNATYGWIAVSGRTYCLLKDGESATLGYLLGRSDATNGRFRNAGESPTGLQDRIAIALESVTSGTDKLVLALIRCID